MSGAVLLIEKIRFYAKFYSLLPDRRHRKSSFHPKRAFLLFCMILQDYSLCCWADYGIITLGVFSGRKCFFRDFGGGFSPCTPAAARGNDYKTANAGSLTRSCWSACSALPRSCPTFCTAAENDGGGEKTTSKRRMESMVGMIMAACNAEKTIAQAIGSVPT